MCIVPAIKTKSKMEWLIGQWQNDEACMPVLFTIDKTAHGFRIQAICQSDGEKLVVSNVKWDGKVLSFNTLTPSNKWRTRNRLTVISRIKATHELTFWETWEKCKPAAIAGKRN